MRTALVVVMSVLGALCHAQSFTTPGGTVGSTPGGGAYSEAVSSWMWQGTIRANTTGSGQYSSFGLYESNTMRWAIYNHPGVSQQLLIAGASGADRFSLTQTGDVGINLHSPQVKLDIAGAQASGLQFRYDQSTNYRIRLSPYWNTAADTRLDFNVERNSGQGFTTVMSVGYSNRVGIGTTSPQLDLEILGWGQVIRNPLEGGYSTLRLYNSVNDPLRALEIDYSGPTYPNSLIANGPVGESAALTTTGAFPLTLGTANTSRLVISATGNIGIGSAAPAGKLDVIGSVYSNATKTNTIFSGSLNQQNANFVGSEGYWAVRTSTNNAFNLDLYNAGSPIVGMTALQNGNFGIGTTIPDAKLSVKGQVHAQEVKVDLNGAIAPDYVFNDDYKLPSLEEIQSYIITNKHLPEVPSAKELEANGMNLGEMNLVLLKKVEELTLYVIELKQENQQIRKEFGERLNALASERGTQR